MRDHWDRNTSSESFQFWLRCDLNLPDISWDTRTVKGNQNSAQINNRFFDNIQNSYCSLEKKGHTANQDRKYP